MSLLTDIVFVKKWKIYYSLVPILLISFYFSTWMHFYYNLNALIKVEKIINDQGLKRWSSLNRNNDPRLTLWSLTLNLCKIITVNDHMFQKCGRQNICVFSDLNNSS